MNPIWRERLGAAAAALVAIWLSFQLADGAWAWPLLISAIAVALIFVRIVGISLDVLVIGFLLVGYIVGNRGFAQLMPLPGIPLLPAELGLAIAGAVVGLRFARSQALPWERNALNYLLLGWLILGTGRAMFDCRQFGFLALRDFATVYYAAFFFIVQAAAANEDNRRFLLRCVLVASAILPVVFLLSEAFPGFFLGTLTIHGVPLVYFKGDLAPTFLGIGGIVLFLCSPPRWRWLARSLAIAMIIWVFTGDNRSSMVGILAAFGWMLLSRFRRFVWLQAAIGAFAFLLLVGFAGFSENPWAREKLGSITERAMTVVDLAGRFQYQQAYSVTKTENNQFRWIWWRTVAGETMAQNPVLGLGFGYDLARGFLREYNPDLGEDFSARSPHNILLTVFGRMGFLGLAIFLAILAVIALHTARTMRNPQSEPASVALWVSLWPIIASACLGVVLEGPMGAVVFWCLLGLAASFPNASSREVAAEAQNLTEPLPDEPAVLSR